MNAPSSQGEEGITIHVTIAPLPGCAPTGCAVGGSSDDTVASTGIDAGLAVTVGAVLLALGAAALIRARIAAARR